MKINSVNKHKHIEYRHHNSWSTYDQPTVFTKPEFEKRCNF